MSEGRPAAPPDAVTAAWWDAAAVERLVLQRCRACARFQHHPGAVCRSCGSTDLGFEDAAGTGVVHSFTVVHRAPHPAFEPPYVVALIELDEGPRMVSNVVDCPHEALRCGMPVTVRWTSLDDGRRLPVFAPRQEDAWTSA